MFLIVRLGATPEALLRAMRYIGRACDARVLGLLVVVQTVGLAGGTEGTP